MMYDQTPLDREIFYKFASIYPEVDLSTEFCSKVLDVFYDWVDNHERFKHLVGAEFNDIENKWFIENIGITSVAEDKRQHVHRLVDSKKLTMALLKYS